ncbi:MAG: methionine--tRNA ligase [bacterium]
MDRHEFYVTTPIYYVNDRPHIGHAYTTILADVLARYHRLLGGPTWFLTGTDEHGQKVQQAATREGLTPKQQADRTVVRFQELWKKLEITHDDFIRTTEPRHTTVVQKILQDLYARGEIYRAEYDGWYCVPCERFFTEKDLDGQSCPDCHRPVERIQEANYFFRMSRHQEWLVQYIQDHPSFIQPDARRNETLGFLRRPLNDLCISRPKRRLNWGIELPFDSDYVCYVWFDALVNYISAVGYMAGDAAFARWWPASLQLIGKDILTTHTVYWPTMLHAMGLPLPEMVFAHGWWLIGDSKMSKSDGNVVNPMEMAERYGVDAFRYFLMAEMVLGQDAGFTEEAFVRRYNTDLANDLGNVLSRVLHLIGTACGGALPAAGVPGAEETRLRDATLASAETMRNSITGMRLDLGLAAVGGVLREANRYIDGRKPWALAKAGGDTVALGTVLYTCAETLRIVSALLYPVMPGKMTELRTALGLSPDAPDMAGLQQWGQLVPGTKMSAVQALFPRIHSAPAAVVTAPKVQAPDTVTATPVLKKAADVVPDGIALIEYADFQKVHLRAARILTAEKVPAADKLLKLTVDAGGVTMQIVAGIAQHYASEALAGKTVVVVTNLKPAKIRGLESQGMLLAASSGGVMRIVTVDGDLPPGAVVK